MKNELELKGFSTVAEEEMVDVNGGGRTGAILFGATCVAVGGVIALTGGAALLGGAAVIAGANSLGVTVAGISIAFGGVMDIANNK